MPSELFGGFGGCEPHNLYLLQMKSGCSNKTKDQDEGSSDQDDD